MKILIVDDEPGLAAGLAQWLVENGWDAPGVATTRDDAIRWINENGRVDVLITDVVLGDSDGFALRESILPHLPKMRTIFISAYDLSAYATRLAGCPVLAKPVTGEALDEAIRALFEAPAPAASAPQPQPVAATPQPRAVPVATPKVAAQPTAVPAATPQPVAAPRGAVAAPRAVAAAKSAATPAATPMAVQAAPAAAVAKVPSVAATPTPSAVPAAKAPVQAKPAVSAAKVAAVPAVAKVQPAAAASKPAAVPASAGSEIELPPDELVGTAIGNYQIEARIGQGSQGGIYRATQTNMGRQVRLYVLDRERSQDPAEIQKFIANASVKANVSHPYLFAVYEAGQSNGTYFYSCEYVPCRSLRQLREAGAAVDEMTALQVMKVVAEVLAYFHKENIAHELITENTILIGPNNRPRVANIAAYEAPQSLTPAAEMTQLGNLILGVLPESASALGVRQLAAGLAAGQTAAYANWPALGQAVTALEPKVAPEDAYKLDAQERAAIRMVEQAKQRQKKSMLVSSLVSLGLLAFALAAIYFMLFRDKGGHARNFDRMIPIPAGEFVYQDGEKVTLPAFFIDEFEVTIAQYAEFLDYLKNHPDEAAKFDHPKQPKGKSHVPKDWADQQLATGPMPGYYARAKRWGKFHDAALDVNCPVFGVDWFDAWAYAKWKGRRLPTEKEWEKAARGTEGFKYPWGNGQQVKWVNTGADTNADPKKGGEVDGHDRWSPVDAMKKDKSPFGVMDMAGNVSEWTDSLDEDPKMPGNKIPVIRGGNWRTGDYAVTRRVLVLTDLDTDEALGFRTASDKPPAQAAK